MRNDVRRQRWLRFLVNCLCLSWCLSPLSLLSAAPNSAAAAAAAPAAAHISTITLERDCTGCATGSLLVLRRDGTASFTQTGKSRLGTKDKNWRGSLRTEDFEALARMVVARGFFQFEETYADPELQDGNWSSLSIVAGGQDKRVFRRDAAGPAALLAIEAAIEAARSGIHFVALP